MFWLCQCWRGVSADLWVMASDLYKLLLQYINIKRFLWKPLGLPGAWRMTFRVSVGYQRSIMLLNRQGSCVFVCVCRIWSRQ